MFQSQLVPARAVRPSTIAHVIAAFLFTILSLPSSALVQDTAPPALMELKFAPNSVDTANGGATVKVDYSVIDDLSGIKSIGLCLQSPSQMQVRCGSPDLPAPVQRVTGAFTVRFPQYSETGLWTVWYLEMVDAVSNAIFLGANDLIAKGWPGQISVAGVQDTHPPTLTNLSFTPDSVDATNREASVKVDYSVTEYLSGVKSIGLCFQSPSQTQVRCGSPDLPAPVQSATGSFTVAFPQYSEIGRWTVWYLELVDAVGNTIFLGTNDLIAKGWPGQISVDGVQDTNPPTLKTLSFTPDSVDTTNGAANLKVDYSVTDDLSGVKSISLCLQGPSQNQVRCGSPDLPVPSRNVTGSFIVTFPQYSETGRWTVWYLELVDAPGNKILLGANDLIPKGWPGQIAVGQQDHISPVTIATMSPLPNAGNWVNSEVIVMFTASDNFGGTGVKHITVNLTGAQSGSTLVTGSLAQIPVSAHGITTVTYFATDKAGNEESAKSIIVRIDKTSPVIGGMPEVGCTIWPPNHKLVQIAAATARDSLSGLAAFTVTGTSNDPAGGQIVITGGPSQYTIQLSADKGQIYSLTATATDLAGNIAVKKAVCAVPPDQGE